ncbi:unnamed protein product [Caenorhabditis angaria]|uniref:Uncharacterized protein n=1 Tax=Caenorhabditis angaria TaxID=860376 RepID=A0A9P1IYJ2_9PELO|nr:unnamed protein product [Caenorhabditis angaria]
MQSLIISALLIASAQGFLFGNLGLPNLFGGNACDPCAAAAAARPAPYYAPPPRPQYFAPQQQYAAPQPQYVAPQPRPVYTQPQVQQTYTAPEPVATGYVQPPPPPPPATYVSAPVAAEATAVAVDNVAASGYKN